MNALYDSSKNQCSVVNVDITPETPTCDGVGCQLVETCDDCCCWSECNCETCETCESETHGVKNVGDTWDSKNACTSFTCTRKDNVCKITESDPTPCQEKPIAQKGFYIEETIESGKCCPIYSNQLACKACDAKQMELSCPIVEQPSCGKCARTQVKNLIAGEECCCPCDFRAE